MTARAEVSGSIGLSAVVEARKGSIPFFEAHSYGPRVDDDSIGDVSWILLGGLHGGLQERGEVTSTVEVERDQTWYRRQDESYRTDTRAIIQQKAQVRAAQRTARIASMNWYGMSNSRPTAAPTPFMTLYSPVWQQPGGRPFAWEPALVADERGVRAIVRAIGTMIG